MNSPNALTHLCVACCLLASSMAVTTAHADDDHAEWRDAGTVLSVPQVLQKLQAAGYHQVEKIKLKRGSYEVRTLGRDGERIKLHVNAQTGDILGRRDAHKNDDNAGNLVQKLMGQCNERRCRDDTPAAPNTAGQP